MILEEQGQEGALIELRDLGVKFNQRWVLKDVNLAVRANEVLTLVGPNGAGKTTLLKVMIGLLKPSVGRRSVQRGLKIGYMPQQWVFDPILPLTVKAFLNLAPKRQALEVLLETLGVLETLDRQMVSLSGGERQRVLLARALMTEPDVLVLDEPSQGIDLLGQEELYKLLRRVRSHHRCSIIMVSHDLHVVMSETERVVCLNQHVCCEGHPEQVTRDPAFQHLFGDLSSVAWYTHHHNHQHTVEGGILDD